MYPVRPPKLAEGDKLLHDEPGRCGGLDSHSHHFRVVIQHCITYLLVCHGGGEERIRLSGQAKRMLEPLDSDSRYWLLQMLYHTQQQACEVARDKERARWTLAAVEKRIKVRRKRGQFRVEITPPVATAAGTVG